MQRWGLGWCLPASSSLQRHQGPVFPPLHSVYEDYFPLLSPIPCYFTQRQLSPLPHALFHSPSCAKPTCQGGGKAASRCFAAALPSLRGWQVKQMTRVYLFYFKFFFFLTPPHGEGAVRCQPGRCRLLMTAAEGAGSRCLLPHQSGRRYF